MDCPIDRNARCDRKAVFSVADGRLQTSIKPKLPIVARQPRPRIDGARNGNAVRAGHLDSRDVPVLKELERQPRGSMTRAIDADDIAAANLDERKGIAADTSHRGRSEEHTSELQSLMRSSYAVFCLKKKNTHREQRSNKQE